MRRFDVVIGNPPYADRSKASGSGDGGIGVSLDDRFVMKALDLSDDIRLIIRSKHFNRVQSKFRQSILGSGKVKRLIHLPTETFDITNTETCILHIDTFHKGLSQVKYATGESKDIRFHKDSLVVLKNPDYVPEVPNNMSYRYMSGKLPRNQIRHMKNGIRMIEICGREEQPQIVSVDPTQDITGLNQHGVVMNFAARWGGLGRLYIKPYDTAISNSIAMLKTNSERESQQLLKYLETEDIKRRVKDNMASFHPTKSLFKTIPDIDILR